MTHPFHPLFGREFELVTQKQAWGEDRVYFRDKSKRLHHVPLGWTSVAPADPFRAVANGRCRFRTEDLLRLADLVDRTTVGERPARKEKYAASVNTTTPHPDSTAAAPRRRRRVTTRAK
ncbi:MAG: DUF5372 family protein [Myxococcaceae bacterium]